MRHPGTRPHSVEWMNRGKIDDYGEVNSLRKFLWFWKFVDSLGVGSD